MGLQLGAARLKGPSGPRKDAIPNLLCRTVNAEMGRAQLFALADRWLPGQQHRRPSIMGADFKLQPHPKIPETDKPVLVIVIDGWGDDQANDFNAVSRAETPCMDSFKKTAPEHWMLVKAHGTAVGLPSDADMGNSEVSSVVERTGTMSDSLQPRLALQQLFVPPAIRFGIATYGLAVPAFIQALSSVRLPEESSTLVFTSGVDDIVPRQTVGLLICNPRMQINPRMRSSARPAAHSQQDL